MIELKVKKTETGGIKTERRRVSKEKSHRNIYRSREERSHRVEEIKLNKEMKNLESIADHNRERLLNSG